MHAAPPPYAFRPAAVMIALAAHHLGAGIGPDGNAAEAERRDGRTADGLTARWGRPRQALRCQVGQHALSWVLDPLFGKNEHRVPNPSTGPFGDST
jgi:hypothetical protein